MNQVKLPRDFPQHLSIANAPHRFDEALSVAGRVSRAGVELRENLDHAAIFTDPPHLVAGPIKSLGYESGWDARCYPSPVDGHDYINVSARLPETCAARDRGWFDYIAVVHPLDREARNHMLSQNHGNPFIHHMTFGIAPPPLSGDGEVERAGTLVRHMVDARRRIQDALGERPGTLIAALPQAVVDDPAFLERWEDWTGDLGDGERQLEAMDGGGYLIQFFVLEGGRIEVALRLDTRQTFNPKSVVKISRDEISAVQQ